MLQMKIDTQDLRAVLVRMPDELLRESHDALDHVSRKFLKVWKQERLQGGKGVKASPGGIFTKFKRSFITNRKGASIGVRIWTDSRIAELQEKGGTVRAPGGGGLAVPLKSISAAASIILTRGGKVKKAYKDLRNKKNIEPIQFKGKWFLTKVNRRTNAVLPLFVLQKKINLRPRLGFFETWTNQEGVTFAILADKISRGIKKSWAGAA